MATLPARLVEIEFDTGVWTDVAADVVSVWTRRGRNRESGAFETGTMMLTVRNDTRKYDPDHAAGPYYGKLRPNRRVRFRATWNAVTYPVFQGYIDRISQLYGGPNDATAEIQVSDLFKILNRVELPPSAYAAEIGDDLPALWWKLDEPSGSATVADSSGNNRGGTAVNATLGAAGLIVRDPGGAVSFTETANQYVTGKVTIDQATPWAIEFWLRLPANPAFIVEVLHATVGTTPSASANYLSFQINNVTRRPAVLVGNSAGTTYQAASTTALNANQTYHVVVTHNSDRVLRLYLNGVLDTTGDTTAGTFSLPDFYIGSASGLTAPNATIDEVAVYVGGATTALSAGRIGTHNTVGRTPWNGDLPGTRLTRIFTLAGVGDYVLDTGVQTLQATNLGGTALGYAQKVEETDAGRLFVTAEGDVRFLDRLTADTGPYLTSQTTLVDDDSGAGRPYRFVSADVDEATVVTRATVSREGSVTRTYNDTTAQAEYKIIAETHEGLLHNSDDYSMRYAEWVVNTHRTPATRVGTIELALAKEPATMYPDILGLELAERVTYKRKPQNTGAIFSQEMRVEAIEHSTGGHYWDTRLFLTPFNLGQGGWGTGVWDTSLWDQATWGL